MLFILFIEYKKKTNGKNLKASYFVSHLNARVLVSPRYFSFTNYQRILLQGIPGS